MTHTSRWLELVITCSPQLTDAVTDYLIGVFDAGVEFGVEDHLLLHTLHVYLEKENPSPELIAEITEQVRAYLNELAEIFSTSLPTLTSSVIEDEDWSSSWKKHFTPFSVTPGLVIKPSWEEYLPASTELVIEMDPGMAFGTGHHATTSLCLGFMRKVLQERPGPALDVGTGTGILAMAAALFGARQVMAIDNDPAAVEAAQENIVKNGLSGRVEVSQTPLEELEGKYALVVANIIHDVLLVMAPDLTRLTESGGTLVLSGILAGEQADNIIRVYGEAGFSLTGKEEKGEWAALGLKKETA